MPEEIAIRVENVSKDFVLPHEKVNSVKGLVTGITKRRGRRKTKETQHALKDISFEIKQGEFFGIVGRNGSGKSTMLKILAGIYQPTKGKVYTRGKLVPFIELGVGFNPELTGRENVYLNGAMLGFSEKEVDAMYDSIVKFAELERFMDQKLKNYSSGMQVRLAFSLAIRAEADILLIDEVLAVGDADFQKKCYDYFKSLKKDKKTVVFVSHDMEAVREYCDRAMLIEKSEAVEIGSSDRIAERYKQLFIDRGEHTSGDSKNRWGSAAAAITSVKVQATEDEIIIDEIITANKAIDGCVAGFRIKNAAGDHITGTNTTLENHNLGAKKAGGKYRLRWKLPNILSEGRYYLDPTVHNGDASEVYDWWEDAARFSVQKKRKLPFYSVDPTFVLEELEK
jgi:ABC-2 type transport system ATP-binding protein